jgi:hypothetical protein
LYSREKTSHNERDFILMAQQLVLPTSSDIFEVGFTEQPLLDFIQDPLDLIRVIQTELPKHLASLDLNRDSALKSKDFVRACHASQRAEFFERERGFLDRRGRSLLRHFAEGSEVNPAKVEPYVSLVQAETENSEIFRLATLLWSVPVSRGYGRRMRYLVRDRANEKVIGIFALTDPVFNLKPRDVMIGWNATHRKQRLVNLMDAHIVGAVPPYSSLLGGKVVASLMTSQDVCNDFALKYGNRKGIISNTYKEAQLLFLTVTSALGRSSMYNRLKLQNIMNFEKIGLTTGWGHFHIPQQLFQTMRDLLQLLEDPYAVNNRFGQGPNWRLRVIRKSLTIAGLNDNLLKHGIQREVYATSLVDGWKEYLCGETEVLPIPKRPTAAELGKLAVERWLIPRSQTHSEFEQWTREDTWSLLTKH